MNIFYSQIAIHKKNMWAQWANKFFDALQLVNKNCLNTFHSINIFFLIHTKIFSHFNSKIGSEWMWKYIVHPVREPNNITSKWTITFLIKIRGKQTIFSFVILLEEKYFFNFICSHFISSWFCSSLDSTDFVQCKIESVNVLRWICFSTHYKLWLITNIWPYQEGVFVLDVQPVLLFQQCHLLHWQHLNWCTFHLVRYWNPTIQHLEQYPHELPLVWSVLVLLLMKSLSS